MPQAGRSAELESGFRVAMSRGKMPLDLLPGEAATVPRLSIYMDESGDGKDATVHVACAVGVVDERVAFADAEEEWRRAGVTNWVKFHAAGSLPGRKARSLTRFGKLLGSGDMIAVAAVTEPPTPSRVDLVQCLIVLAAMGVISRLRALLVPAPGSKLEMPCDVLIEARQNFNNRVLADEILARVRRMNADKRQGFLNVSPHVMSVPKGAHPLVQAADLWSHAVRAELLASLAWPAGVPRPHVDIHASRALRSTAWRAYVEKVEQSLGGARPKRSAPPGTPLSSDLIVARVRDVRADGDALTLAAVQDLLDDLDLEQPPFRVARIDGILSACNAIIESERDYGTAEALVTVLDWIHHRATARRDISATTLARWQVQAAALWLLPRNHRGEPAAGDPRIVAARASCRTLVADPRNWDTIAWLENFVAVNLNDEFRFSEARDVAMPLAEMLAETQDGPFGAIVPRGRHIGALFGTLAQSLAFCAHDAHLAGSAALAGSLGLEAIEYSKLAVLNFDDDDDRRRHDVYQAHVHMQQCMLTGNTNSLASAEARLASRPSPAKAVGAFVAALPSPRAIVPGFRVAALLKLAWLQGASPPWLPELSAAVHARHGSIATHHPMQQILGYLALLGTKAHRPAFRKRIDDSRWPDGLVALLAAFHAAQADVATTGRVAAPTQARALRHLATRPDSPLVRAWRAEINSWGRAPTTPRAPLRAVPFNYC